MTDTAWDSLWIDAAVATLDPDRPGAYGLVPDGAVAVANRGSVRITPSQ